MSVRLVLIWIVFGSLVISSCTGRQVAPVVPTGSSEIEQTEPADITEAQSQETPPTSSQSAPVYSALFEKGRVFRYRHIRQTVLHDEEDPNADENGNVIHREESTFECQVAEIHTFAESRVSEISCEDQNELIAGFYVANNEGLYRLYDMPEDPNELSSAQQESLIIHATPREFHIEQEIEEDGESEYYSHAFHIRRSEEGTWCSEHAYSGADEYTSTICLDADRGIVSIEESSAEVVYESNRIVLF